MIAALMFASALHAPCALADEYARSQFRIERGIAHIAARDFDADGDLDLVFIESGGFGLRRMRADKSYPEQHDSFLGLPSARMAWDLAELGPGGRSAIVTLIDGKQVRVYSLDEGGEFDEGVVILETRGYIPRGVSRADFVRDVDGDGLLDIVIPAAGRFRIHLGREAGGYADPIEVVYEAEIGYEVGDPAELHSRFGQRLAIPWFRIEDVDGDGREDLVSETEDEVFFHIADPGLPSEPTWRLDLASLRDQLPKRDGFNLDDLLSNIDAGVAWRLEDLDGSYPADLVLQLGSTFRIHLGAARTGPDGSPDQILKLSGNLLYFFLRDVEGGPLPDLQLLRGEKISLGTVIRWLVLPGSLDFDLFTYENQGGTFTRRPSRRNRVSFEFPRLLSFMDEVEELEELIGAQAEIPTTRFAARPGGPEKDVVDLRGQELLIYLGRAPETSTGESIGDFDGDIDGLIEDLVLHDLDTQGDGGSQTIDLGDLKDWKFSPGAALREACGDAEPDRRIALDWSGLKMEIRVADLDGDEWPDFVVVGEEQDDDGAWYVVQLLVRLR